MKAIPTKINHLQFRSRLEATWAEFFTILKWKWEYEPVDADGYIPDFAVLEKTGRVAAFFEVKPVFSSEEPAALEAAEKMLASGLLKDYPNAGLAIAGATVQGRRFAFAIDAEGWQETDPPRCFPGNSIYFSSLVLAQRNGYIDFHTEDFSWVGWIGGEWAKGWLDEDDVVAMWNKAKSRVQWKPSVGKT